jgi:hypothetical protein
MTAVQVTLATANTPYRIIALVRATPGAEEAEGEPETLLLEADAANAADSKISVGDASVATDRYGYQLGPGDAREYSAGRILLGELWVMASVDGLKLNVEIM